MTTPKDPMLELQEKLAYMEMERDEAIQALKEEREKMKKKLETAGAIIAKLKNELNKKVDG